MKFLNKNILKAIKQTLRMENPSIMHPQLAYILHRYYKTGEQWVVYRDLELTREQRFETKIIFLLLLLEAEGE
jgi:hypothetical protein